jgi:glycerol-3-phosphate O-acyltransferase
MVTPASLLATVLLIHEKRGITRTDLRARAEELVQVFRRLDAPVARAITDRAGALRPDTLETAIALFLDAKLVTVTEGAGDASVLAVPEGKRLAVEYFKNNVLHFFVPSALVASSLAALGWEAPMTALRDRVRELSRLFKLEFHYRADAPFEEIFSDALGRMIEAGEVIWEGDVVRRGPGRDGARVEVYAEMIRTYLEAYVLALDSVKAEQALPVARKDWSKQILARGQRAFAAGDITLRETVSKPKLESALSAFHELGLVRLDGNDIREGGPEASASLARWRTLLESHLAR